MALKRPPDMRVQWTRSSASPPHSPLTRGPLDGRKGQVVVIQSVVTLLAVVALASLLEAVEREKPTPFQVALAEADKNLKSEEGKRYDKDFAVSSGPWLQPAMMRCTDGLSEKDLEPFMMLIRVGDSGRAEEILIGPVTRVAKCLKPEFARAKHPSPPRSSWWVEMKIDIK